MCHDTTDAYVCASNVSHTAILLTVALQQQTPISPRSRFKRSPPSFHDWVPVSTEILEKACFKRGGEGEREQESTEENTVNRSGVAVGSGSVVVVRSGAHPHSLSHKNLPPLPFFLNKPPPQAAPPQQPVQHRNNVQAVCPDMYRLWDLTSVSG